MDIKYQYAINSKGRTVNAVELIANIEVRSETYKCLSCGNILIPVLGEKRKKHFRHKADIEIQCSQETYLHKLGKIRFYEIYSSCLSEILPFWIEIAVKKKCQYQKQFQSICPVMNSKETFDLTQYFKNIKLEKKDNYFIPDLLLTSDKGDKVYIEIAVSHKSTQRKIHSGNRIIELAISQESDLNILDRRILSESNRVIFFNFKRDQIKNFCNGQCIQINNLKPKIEEIKPKKNMNKREEVKKSSDSRNKRNDALLRHLAKLQLKENCFFCHHYAINAKDTIDTPIYCKVRKKTCNPHVARNCKHYQPDIKLISDVTDSQMPN
ncbi:MAG: hypothetical protein KME32_32400 [Mojavia pulchra JT2-VF2]|jgi:hypothetical protein|uniref:Competence protein CoiA-like family protein n=1 Tax=Mojavia pulchra JT2-VF2 TaxID=287848 RepID=A0A951Q5I0_9NOST|nr:hypothetical protein [Mojavia pulchra JT2-VF2]